MGAVVSLNSAIAPPPLHCIMLAVFGQVCSPKVGSTRQLLVAFNVKHMNNR